MSSKRSARPKRPSEPGSNAQQPPPTANKPDAAWVQQFVAQNKYNTRGRLAAARFLARDQDFAIRRIVKSDLVTRGHKISRRWLGVPHRKYAYCQRCSRRVEIYHAQQTANLPPEARIYGFQDANNTAIVAAGPAFAWECDAG
jgi:hypothetical protein